MAGRFYSKSITTTGDDEDLFDTIKTDLVAAGAIKTGQEIVASALTVISANDIGIDLNNLGTYSGLYLDSDSLYKLSISEGQMRITSVKIETTGHAVWIGIVF